MGAKKKKESGLRKRNYPTIYKQLTDVFISYSKLHAI